MINNLKEHVWNTTGNLTGGLRRALDEVVHIETRRSGSSPYTPPRYYFWILGTPVVVLMAAVAVFRLTDLDLLVSSTCYDPSSTSWPWARSIPWVYMYEYGCLPAVFLGTCGFLLAGGGLRFRRLRRFVRPGLFLAVTLAIGPGVIVNGVLKPSIGRPRPKEVVQFGGHTHFVPLASYPSANDRSPGGANASFPSGHASMGFYFIAPAALLYRRRKRLAVAVLVSGLSFGTIVGAARVVQGAHFVSDVIGSALFVYLSVLVTHLAFEWLIEARHGAVLRRMPVEEPAVYPFSLPDEAPREEQQVA